MFCSCFELSEGMDNITSLQTSNSLSTPDSSTESGEKQKSSADDGYPTVVQRRAISLVQPPSISSLIHSLEPLNDAENAKETK